MKYGVPPEKTFGPGYPEGTVWIMVAKTDIVALRSTGKTAFEAAQRVGLSLSEVDSIDAFDPVTGKHL